MLHALFAGLVMCFWFVACLLISSELCDCEVVFLFVFFEGPEMFGECLVFIIVGQFKRDHIFNV